MYSPLEQFTLTQILPLHIGSFYFSFSNSAFFMCLSLAVFSFTYWLVFEKGGHFLPGRWQSFFEVIYEFALNLVKEQVGQQGQPYFPLIFTVFAFLLCNNLIGMIPYSFTSTSHFVITFSLSVSLFIGVTLIGFQKHGLHFFSFLLPPGAPLALSPFLVVMELVSYSFRAISLGVRLFANMMAGHTLVKILSGFSWTMMSAGPVFLLPALIPFGVVFALTFLEIGVACLQAYVFTILLCIYLNDAIHLH